MSARAPFPRIGRTLFAWGSALVVAACGAWAASGAEVRIMGAGAERGLLLSYAGALGSALALVEAALVLAAWYVARGQGSLARTGAWALVAWAALWAVNALRWTLAAPDATALAVTALLAGLLACTWLTALERRAAHIRR